MNGDARMPRSVTFQGHPRGAETFYATVLVLTPVRATQSTALDADGRRVPRTCDASVGGIIVGADFERWLEQHHLYSDSVLRNAIECDITRPTYSFKLRRMFGAPVRVVQEEDSNGQA